MNSLSLTLLILLILFIAMLVRSIFGFGDAVLAMPLLTLIIDLRLATPLFALVAGTMAATIAYRQRQDIEIGAVWRLVIASALGIPVGLFILTNAPEQVVKSILGSLLILFGLYNLTHPRLFRLSHLGWSYPFGFIAGVLGGAYNTNGPPIVIYGSLRRWSPVEFRATLQGYFVMTSFFIIAGHGLAGLWTVWVWQLYILALPVVFTAVLLGSFFNQRLPTHRFDQFIYLLLIILGLLMWL